MVNLKEKVGFVTPTKPLQKQIATSVAGVGVIKHLTCCQVVADWRRVVLNTPLTRGINSVEVLREDQFSLCSCMTQF